MQFQVPQFIETEDKIVGPLTLRQFLYAGGAVAISAMLYFVVNATVWFVLSLPVIALGFGLAFIKINGQPLTRVLLAAASYYWKPQTYVWHPENPALPKTESTLKTVVGGGFSLERILSGLALKSAWERVQTGSKTSADLGKRAIEEAKERYEVLQRITGERKTVRRVDYR